MWRRLIYNSAKMSLLGSGVYLSTQIVFAADKLYGWGWNNFGQLGVGHSNTLYSPRIIPLQDILIASCKGNISAAIDKSGKLYTWGRSKFGLLGNGYSDNINTPTLVDTLKDLNFKAVACGNYHMAAITVDGDLYCWGNSDHGKLGHSYDKDAKLPSREKYDFNKNLGSVVLPAKAIVPFKVKQAALGDQFTVLLSQDGLVYSIGLNKKGVLGYESTNLEETKYKQIESLKDIVKVESGTDFSVALDVNGNLYAWGSNYFGQLGSPSPSIYQVPHIIPGLPKIKDFSCGEQFVGAIDTEGKLFTWGYGNDGQLGQVGKQDIATPHLVDFPNKVHQISCGLGHIGIVSDGQLYMFGRGKEGQLGRGTETESPTTSRVAPQLVMSSVVNVHCGGSHTLAIVN